MNNRLLAHAGFDPRHAVRFWEGRQECERTAECSPKKAVQKAEDQEWLKESTPMRWVGSSHPINIVRTDRLKEELQRWEEQREKTRRRLQQEAADASS